MMDNHHLRGIILKLENRLSDNDRKRLHFFLGNDVPRRIRDDPSLGGTLNLMESLFDQDKINEHDFTFLINAFDEIQCFDAVKLLREHMRRIQSNKIHESIQSLAYIMPSTIEQSLKDQDNDRYSMQSPFITRQSTSNNNIEMISINNTKINSATEIVGNYTSRSNRKKLSNASSMRHRCSLSYFCLLLLIIGLGIMTGVIIVRSHQLTKELKTKDKSIFEERAKNNEIMHQLNSPLHNRTIQQLIDRLQQSLEEQTKYNKTIQQLNTLRSVDNQTIRQLTHQSNQLLQEQTKNNQTIQQLTRQWQQSLDEQIKYNETIQQLNILRSVDNQTIQHLTNRLRQSLTEPTLLNKNDQIPLNQINDSTSTQKSERIEDLQISGWGSCGCPSVSTCQTNCIRNFGGTLGRCSGAFGMTCECLIGRLWQSRTRGC